LLLADRLVHVRRALARVLAGSADRTLVPVAVQRHRGAEDIVGGAVAGSQLLLLAEAVLLLREHVRRPLVRSLADGADQGLVPVLAQRHRQAELVIGSAVA